MSFLLKIPRSEQLNLLTKLRNITWPTNKVLFEVTHTSKYLFSSCESFQSQILKTIGVLDPHLKKNIVRSDSRKSFHSKPFLFKEVGQSCDGAQTSINFQPPAPPQQQKGKKTRAPRINLALVEELQKVDKDFAVKQSAVQALFPFPKNNLHNAFAVISSQLGTTHSVGFTYKQISQSPQCWQCDVTIAWPADSHFSCLGASKSEAGNRASLLALLWLQTQGKINKKGEVELMVQTSSPAMKHQAVAAEIQLSAESLRSIEHIVNRYYEEVSNNQGTEVNVVQTNATESQTIIDSDDEADLDIDSLPLQRQKSLAPPIAARRDQELFRRQDRLKDQRDKLSSALPINKFKDQIVELVTNNSVVVIKGEPGCGKSTQVPQYLFEYFAERRAGTDCNLVVTQPRRISAIALADRLASERNERIGDVVGFHVRLNARHPRYQDGFILFCSTGLLVRKMIGDPGLFGVTHVIVDEAHERDTQLDFLLLLLKRAIALNPALKVIVMSATINAELFTQYFNNCPSISIPGFTHPVKHHFLDIGLRSVLERQGVKFDDRDGDVPTVNTDAVVAMVKWIDDSKPDGAILVFLPGWMEIRTVMEQLALLGGLTVLPAHSKLSSEEQRRIFQPARPGTRKVILATNIAETSLTISDVVYVVDTGAVKEERVDMKTGLVSLDNQWASQANVKQRRGRAGRVQPGECYHLFSAAKYDSLEEFPMPELHRIPLTKAVLDVKMYTRDEDIGTFLSCLPEPPNKETVTRAVKVLQGMGALDADEDLTSLGRRIYRLPLDPHLAKALVHACFFKCTSPLLSIATLLSADFTVMENSLGLKSRTRLLKQQYSPGSDHLATARLYHEWENLFWSDPHEAQAHCSEQGLLHKSLDRARQLRGLHSDLLKATKLVPEGDNVNDILAPCNKFSPYDELVKGVLLSGLGNILISHKPANKRGLVMRTSEGIPAVISSESVNAKFKELPTPFLTYFKSISSTERRVILVHETSLLSPVSLVLFLPAVMTLKKMAGLDMSKSVISIETRKPINIIVDQKDGEQLLHLRQVLWNVLEFLVASEGEGKQHEVVSNFRDELVTVLANVTSEQGANIDYTESGELRTEHSPGRMSNG